MSLWLAPHLARRGDATRLVDWLVEELRNTEHGRTGTAEAAGVRRPR
jgi:hypothetical protein